ncbi:MAG: NAD-dependent epimerase/dehydratase family protein [Promethearchaeota archaeon]
MKVAITGCSGFLAYTLLPLLEKDEEIDSIIGVDIIEPKQVLSKLKFIKRDVRDPQLREDFKGSDALFHLAFIVSPLKSIKEMYSINIEGSKNVFDCAVSAGVKQIIHASSVAAYGAFPDNPVPITEEHPIRLMKKPFYYHETKYLVEKYLDELEQAHPDLIIVRMRPHIFLGPQINNLVREMLKKDKILSFFPDQLAQYVWVDDVAQAFYLAFKKKARGAFNLGADNPIIHREIARQFNKKFNKMPYKFALFLLALTYKLHLQRTMLPGWLRMSRYPIIVDCTKAKKELGWAPKFDTLQTLQAFEQYLKDIGEI